MQRSGSFHDIIRQIDVHFQPEGGCWVKLKLISAHSESRSIGTSALSLMILHTSKGISPLIQILTFLVCYLYLPSKLRQSQAGENTLWGQSMLGHITEGLGCVPLSYLMPVA